MASVKNAAARFNVTPEYVRKLCRTGKICYTAISSRKWLVNMDTLAQFFAQGEPVREDSQQVTNGLVLDSDMLLDDLIDRWFEEYANKQLKAKTLYDYRRMRGRISAGLGHLKVSKIKPAHVMAFYNNLEERGVRRDSTYTATKALLNLLPRGTRGELAKKAGIGQDTMRMVYAGKSVSRKTAEKVSAAVGLAFSKAFVEHTKKDGKLNNNSVIRYQAMLSSIFKKGVQWGLINENPCSRAEHPKAEEIDVRVLTEEEIPKLLDALLDAPPQYSVITQLALLLGARRGEICALRWSDIDFEKGTLSIKRTVQSIPGICLVFNAPKTRRGKRCLRIGADCVELLQEYRRYQKVERFRIGSVWVRKVTLENGKVVDNDMLFTKWNGEPMDPDIISSWFPKFLEAHDLPSIHFHSLRHPYVKHTTKIFSLRLMDFQAQAYPDARRKTRGACQLHQGGQSRSPVRLLCNRKQLSCLPPQSKMSWILYAISMRLSGYTSTRSISSSASSVVSVSASKIALDASLRLSCRACSSCFCFACANTAA